MMNNTNPQPFEGKPVNERIGRNVDLILRYQRKNQTELALSLGITESTMSRRINGSTDWAPDELVKVANHLKLKSVAVLFDDLLPEFDTPDKDSPKLTFGLFAKPHRGSNVTHADFGRKRLVV